MPKVSIVLPTYNGEKYIRESIDSIIKQTFTDWELIIVNDCSIDNTPLILDEYEQKDPRIRVIHNKENKNLPNSLNIGFEFGRGEYYTWTSDDNYYYPDAIKTMVEYLDNNKGTYMVCAGMNIIDSEGNFIETFTKYDSELIYIYNCIGACFMYRSNVLDKMNGYDPDMLLVEDYDFWLRILFEFGNIGYIDEKLYAYRRHDNTLSVKKQMQVKKQLFKLRKKNLIRILEKINKTYVSRLFVEFIEWGEDFSDIRQYFIEAMPELDLVENFETTKKVIVYGAGDYGDKIYRMIKDQIISYADKNPEKIGQTKNGVPIISLEEMLSVKNEYQIIIAGNYNIVYDMIQFLYNNGVKRYSLCQSILVTRNS